MTPTDRTTASDAEFVARLAPFDPALAGPTEVLREALARAIAESDGVDWDSHLTGLLDMHTDYRANADAALSVFRDQHLVDRCPNCDSTAGHWHGCGYGLRAPAVAGSDA